MKTLFAAAALSLLVPAAAAAQPYAPPPGSYQRQCESYRMEGQFLHARCRGAVSSINVMSCSTDIGVGPDGGLICGGPGAGAAPPPGYSAAPRYDDRRYDDRRYDDRRYGDQRYGDRYGRDVATLFAQRGQRGRSVRIEGDTPNLADLGLNDRVRSIQLPRRSGPWLVCTDANFRGRCETITGSVSDTRRIGLDGVSSLRPLREEAYGRRY